MNYTECLDALNALGHELRGVKFDLDAIRSILASLGHPESRYDSAIVAGTNGKGSTCAMLSSILERAGCRTGLYTSPHLIRANERIRVNGEEISDRDFALSFTEVWDAVERLLKRQTLEGRPSFFEYLTATAFVHFARAGVDFVVLEVVMAARAFHARAQEDLADIGRRLQRDRVIFVADVANGVAGADQFFVDFAAAAGVEIREVRPL